MSEKLHFRSGVAKPALLYVLYIISAAKPICVLAVLQNLRKDASFTIAVVTLD